jgi:hypothetical protein
LSKKPKADGKSAFFVSEPGIAFQGITWARFFLLDFKGGVLFGVFGKLFFLDGMFACKSFNLLVGRVGIEPTTY